MHIKQLIISGFRSFRSQNEIETFSPKHNVIVGRNGSGKSNYFDAIQFVLLGPKFATLRPEDRQLLLHNGAGSSVMAAYVEIVFDNSDGRLSVESDEVILRRLVGLKKEEFYLNRKRVQKSEVMSLLESAGFSKSNPYYIVQQGKVANLCVMKDKDRLNLLKEVAGTTVYEERRAESVKIMLDTANKKEKVEEVLLILEERLGELEQEKQEFAEYEQLERQRRALEYSSYHLEFQKASEQLQQIDKVRDAENERQSTLYSDLAEITDDLTQREEAYGAVTQSLARLTARRDTKSLELSELTGRRSAVEVEIQEAEAALRAAGTESVKLSEQLDEVLKQVRMCESQLREIEPEHAEKVGSLNEMQAELASVRAQVEALYGKQGRGTQFRTRAERDAFLQKQIDTLTLQITQKSELLQRSSAEVAAEEARLKTEKQQIDQAELQQTVRQERYDSLAGLIRAATVRRNELQEQRKTTWRELETLQEQVQEARQELEKGQVQLNRSLPKHIIQGLAAVENIVATKNITGYFGPLIDNITLTNEIFRAAVEVAGGNALFHIIVDTDATAAVLINELERLKAGRLTFLPLNRLHVPNITYPQGSDVRSLMEVALQFDAHVDKAVRQVFGHKLLAKDLDTAARYSKECDLDALTRDGDQVNRKGGFEGGFHDDRASRIGAVYKIRESKATLETLLAAEGELKTRSEALEGSINEAVREITQLETERTHLRQNSDQLGREIKNRSKQLQATSQGLHSQRQGIAAMSAQLQTATAQRDAYITEQASEMVHKLSEKERTALSKLEGRQRSLQQALESLETDTMTITNTKDRLHADLHNNLLKRKDELERLLSNLNNTSGMSGSGEDSAQDYTVELAALEETRASLTAQHRTLTQELQQIASSIQTKSQEAATLEQHLEEQRGVEQAQQSLITEATKMLDKLLSKRSLLIETVHSRTRKMRDLGTIPHAELEEYKALSEKHIMHRLNSVNEQLKKYSAVNRKALDQFLSFDKQREHLIARKEEMDTDGNAIQELIQSLDAQKDEAILRTFRGVSRHFSEVFAELVPGGAGQLIMRTTMDQEQESGGGKGGKGGAKGGKSKKAAGAEGSNVNAGEDEDDEALEHLLQDRILDSAEDENTAGGGAGAGSSSNDGLAISTFQGVQVRVSFSGAGQQYQMSQLSGGQKALVALALIFAIQRCDPAPFYLFDEIDQALDANYRAGVARLIQKQVNSESAPAQFITTTFRPELVAVADRCYGIALQDRVSEIRSLEKADAQKFVTDLMMEEEAVGPIQGGAGGRGQQGNNNNRVGNTTSGYQPQQQPQRGGRGAALQLQDEIEGEGEGSVSQGSVDNEEEEEEEEVTSPHKIRRVQRSASASVAPAVATKSKGKAAASKGAAKGALGRGQAKGRTTTTKKSGAAGKGRRRSGDISSEESEESEQSGDDNDDDNSNPSEGEEEERGGASRGAVKGTKGTKGKGTSSSRASRGRKIELDAEEAAAFAHLGLNDRDEEEEGEEEDE